MSKYSMRCVWRRRRKIPMFTSWLETNVQFVEHLMWCRLPVRLCPTQCSAAPWLTFQNQFRAWLMKFSHMCISWLLWRPMHSHLKVYLLKTKIRYEYNWRKDPMQKKITRFLDVYEKMTLMKIENCCKKFSHRSLSLIKPYFAKMDNYKKCSQS